MDLHTGGQPCLDQRLFHGARMPKALPAVVRDARELRTLPRQPGKLPSTSTRVCGATRGARP